MQTGGFKRKKLLEEASGNLKTRHPSSLVVGGLKRHSGVVKTAGGGAQGGGRWGGQMLSWKPTGSPCGLLDLELTGSHFVLER